MSIRIIEEPEIVLTRSEHDRLHREWVQSQSHTTAPRDFESWLRQRQVNEENAFRALQQSPYRIY